MKEIDRYWYLIIARNLRIVALAIRFGTGRTWIDDEIRGKA